MSTNISSGSRLTKSRFQFGAKSGPRYAALMGAASLALVAFLGACASSTASTATESSAPATTQPASGLTQTPTQASPGGRQGGGASGTVATISGTTITLNTQQGQVTVSVSPNAVIEKTVSGATADLQIGEPVTVVGPADASGNIAAASISLRSSDQANRFTPPPGATPNPGGPGRFGGTPSPRSDNGTFGNGVFGTISGVSGSTLTITNTQSQQVTVTINSSTRITKTVSGTLSDVQVGETLTVAGGRDDNGVIDATFITVRPQGLSPGN